MPPRESLARVPCGSVTIEASATSSREHVQFGFIAAWRGADDVTEVRSAGDLDTGREPAR
jgi:hypothetical protein